MEPDETRASANRRALENSYQIYQMKNSSQADNAVDRIHANEVNALRVLRSETKIGRIALAIDALKRDRGLSHFDACQEVRKDQPLLFR